MSEDVVETFELTKNAEIYIDRVDSNYAVLYNNDELHLLSYDSVKKIDGGKKHTDSEFLAYLMSM